MNRWRLAWVLLTVALAGHVLDEALTDFLSFYNPLVQGLGLAGFTYEGWITGLAIGILALAALTPFTREGTQWMRVLSYVYGVIMVLNGLAHIGGSLLLGRWLPGVISSPFLLAAAIFLLKSVPRGQRVETPAVT